MMLLILFGNFDEEIRGVDDAYIAWGYEGFFLWKLTKIVVLHWKMVAKVIWSCLSLNFYVLFVIYIIIYIYIYIHK